MASKRARLAKLRQIWLGGGGGCSFKETAVYRRHREQIIGPCNAMPFAALPSTVPVTASRLARLKSACATAAVTGGSAMVSRTP
ncbi:hypothetical protein JTE90_022785 [Oedothorax gibbosus]|uniref:Uncharacterized protein n=1 Tax=Oedothorax gibbosus TaxID=931172 RepID=A0AAV6U8P9_9ARAC|nr:hypothetical protein JTE90_022785 [Oedothorax gibbosus]